MTPRTCIALYEASDACLHYLMLRRTRGRMELFQAVQDLLHLFTR